MTDNDTVSYMKDGKLVVPWKISEGRIINLLTIEEYNELPLGTEVTCIDGTTKVKSADSKESASKNYIDMYTRFGQIAFGLPKQN